MRKTPTRPKNLVTEWRQYFSRKFLSKFPVDAHQTSRILCILLDDDPQVDTDTLDDTHFLQLQFFYNVYIRDYLRSWDPRRSSKPNFNHEFMNFNLKVNQISFIGAVL